MTAVTILPPLQPQPAHQPISAHLPRTAAFHQDQSAPVYSLKPHTHSLPVSKICKPFSSSKPCSPGTCSIGPSLLPCLNPHFYPPCYKTCFLPCYLLCCPTSTLKITFRITFPVWPFVGLPVSSPHQPIHLFPSLTCRLSTPVHTLLAILLKIPHLTSESVCCIVSCSHNPET